MVEAGFAIERIIPVTLYDRALKPDGLARMMLQLMQAYITKENLAPKGEVGAWASEQAHLAAAGRFFFSITQFVICAVRP